MPTLSIPDAIHHQLAARAAEQNTTAAELLAQLLAADLTSRPDCRFDTEYEAECAADTSPVPTLDEVRAILSKVPGSLAADVITDRDER